MIRSSVPWLLSLAVLSACGSGREDPDDRLPPPPEEPPRAESVSVPEAASIPEPPAENLRSGEPVSTLEPDPGPYQVDGDIERPRYLTGQPHIERLTAMMRSGEYAWGVCIFQLVVTEKGDVADVEILKPENLSPEVRAVIVEEATEWEFSPATRDGEPVPVYYNLLMHHCPFHRIDRTED